MKKEKPLSQEALEFVLENLPIGVMITDSQGNIVKVNAHHSKVTNHPKDTIVGTNLSELVASGKINISSSLKVIKTGRPMVLEQTIASGTDQEKEIIVKCIPMRDESRKLQYVVNYLMDISDKALLVSELKEAQFNNERYLMELKQFRTQENRTAKFIYRSSSMNSLLERAEKIATTDSTVMITGESGTGKSLLARHIHNYSRRSEDIFFSLNCGALPPNLIESELFGYEKGAFSGASSSGKKGVFEYVNGGTLFLDEIGEMPYDLQVKLLGVLQDGAFYRVGGTTSIKTDVRIITATNADLLEKIASHQFRLDLFYRLNVLSFHMPSLRERPEDIPILTEHIIRKINRKFGTDKKFAPEAIQQLMHLPLYGNVRELENLIERNLLFSLSNTITELEMLDLFTPPPSKENGNTPLRSSLHYGCNNATQCSENEERKALIDGIQKYKTTTAMAAHFGVNQSTISRRLKKYHINIKDFK